MASSFSDGMADQQPAVARLGVHLGRPHAPEEPHGSRSVAAATTGVRGRLTMSWPAVAVVFAILLHVSWMTFKPGGAFSGVVFSDLTAIAASGLAGVASVRRARRMSDRTWKGGWLLIGLGMLSWSAGEMVWTWYEVVLRTDVPYPSAADAGYLGMAVLCLAGIARMGSFRRVGLRALLDGLTISASVLFVSWATVLSPVFAAHEQPLPDYVINLAYPVGDVAMATMVTLLLMHGNAGRRSTLGLLCAGLLAFAIADSTFAYLAQSNSYASGDWIDSLWVGGFLLIWLGAQCRKRCGQAPAPAEPGSVWPLISYVPLGAATATAAVVYSVSGRLTPVLYLLTLTIVVLVVLRQAVTLWDNVTLNRTLSGVVSDLRERESELRHLAFHDPLTGLANRALFHDRTEHACAAAVRDRRAVGVLYIDLDDFKLVNDVYGHAAGDTLLIEVANRLRECLRPEDTLGRLGGDEFAVLVDHVSRAADLEEITERIAGNLGRPVLLDGGAVAVPISASIGGALHEPGPAYGRSGADAVSELLRRADLAMYAAKAGGKGRAVTFEQPVRSL